MRICSVCEGNCDDGELVGGICHECRETAEQEKRREMMDRLLESPSKQMSLIFDNTYRTAYWGRFGWN